MLIAGVILSCGVVFLLVLAVINRWKRQQYRRQALATLEATLARFLETATHEDLIQALYWARNQLTDRSMRDQLDIKIEEVMQHLRDIGYTSPPS